MSAAAVWNGGTSASHPVARPRLVLVPAGAAARPVRRARLRITRAGRLVLTTLVLAIALAAGASALSAGAASTHAVTVQPGQTLSEIAARELPHRDVVSAVTDIQLANDLPSSEVSAGRILVIPEG